MRVDNLKHSYCPRCNEITFLNYHHHDHHHHHHHHHHRGGSMQWQTSDSNRQKHRVIVYVIRSSNEVFTGSSRKV